MCAMCVMKSGVMSVCRQQHGVNVGEIIIADCMRYAETVHVNVAVDIAEGKVICVVGVMKMKIQE